MSEKIPVLTFFNNKGGVGKTSLVYHTACMMAELGLRVLACDLDPQVNLSASFLQEEELESLWQKKETGPTTIYGCVSPLMGVKDISAPQLQEISPPSLWEKVRLLPGDMALSRFERHLSSAESDVLAKDKAERALHILSAFWRVVQKGAAEMSADIILIDVGPNLGAINRSALIASDYFVTPLGADIYSLQGLQNLGPTVGEWRAEWAEWRDKNSNIDIPGGLPKGGMHPIGYVVNQPGSVRLDRPVLAYKKWMHRIPNAYHRFVLNEDKGSVPPVGTEPEADLPNYLATIKHYRSLVPLSQEARKPIFNLTVGDGATGSHFTAARNAYKDFEKLTKKILGSMGIQIPPTE